MTWTALTRGPSPANSSFAEKVAERREFAAHARATGMRDTVNNYAKWQTEQQIRRLTQDDQHGTSI